MPGTSGTSRGSRALEPRLRHRIADLVHGPGRRRLLLLRRTAAATLAAFALVLALIPRAAPSGTTILVAARDLAPGTTLAAADLAVREWPTDLVPAGALRALTDADGRMLAGAARAGEPLTDLRLAGPILAARAVGSDDAVSVPVRLADPGVAGLLAPGRAVDVVTTGPTTDEPLVLAGGAVVLAVLPADTAPGVGAGAARGRLVLVALPHAAATRVAAASLAQPVAITLR
ncbi:SAF domain-containing protein [Pseudonocardia hispaniensis]|uniref:SAF domain-containing protein n=1 Tax=Pseudonocardia hispaniensis TaxID=904933 RepID=A0ABW1J1J2_9PSEU